MTDIETEGSFEELCGADMRVVEDCDGGGSRDWRRGAAGLQFTRREEEGSVWRRFGGAEGERVVMVGGWSRGCPGYNDMKQVRPEETTESISP